MYSKLLMIAALALATLNATAQDTEIAPEKTKRMPGKNEIGLIGETFGTGHYGNSNYSGGLGIQYKRWAKPNIAYRIMGSMGGYNHNSMPKFVDKKGDTVFQTQTYSNIPMYFVGGGLEVQRHFYKKVTLYAALELRAGYGSGTYDEVLVKEVQNDIIPHMGSSTIHHEVSTIARGDVSAFVIDVTPYIGAKINFKRISVGTEATIVKFGMEAVDYSKYQGYSTGNFDMGNFRQRIFVNWRF